MEDFFTINAYKPIAPYGQKKKGIHPVLILFLLLILSGLAAITSYLLVSGKPLTFEALNLSAVLKPAPHLQKDLPPYANPFIEDQFTINPFFEDKEEFSANLFDRFDTNLAVMDNRYENPF